MTQAVINNFNRFEDVLTQSKDSVKDYSAEFAADRNLDFKKVFTTKLEKEPSSIGDLKENVSRKFNSEELADFRKKLAKATSESNVETSLDLTLAKDINEIISQLKEKIEESQSFREELETTTEIVDMPAEYNKDEISQIESGVICVPRVLENKAQIPIVEQIFAMSSGKNDSGLDLEFEIANENTIDLSLENTAEMISEVVTEDVASAKKESVIDDLEQILDEEMIEDLNIESISADSESFDGESLLQQGQSPEEYALKNMINSDAEVFDVKIDRVMNSQNIQASQVTQAKSTDINPARILEQVAKQMEGMQNGSKVNIVLNPESLGKVNIQLLTTKDGLTAQLTVASNEVRDILMKGLDGLKDTLLSHGVSVDNVSVKLSDTQKSTYNPDWTEQEGSRGGNKGQGQPNREEKEKGLFEQMMAQVEEFKNGNV